MLRVILCFCLLFGSFLKGQTFYEKIMEMNVVNSDTSTDRAVLDMSAKALERVTKGMSNNFIADLHINLCFVRMTDISLILKDTIGAKIAVDMSATQMKKVHMKWSENEEVQILQFYHKLNELRIGKPDLKKIKALETQLENFKKKNSLSPRFYLVNAYFYKCFYSANKAKRKLAQELLQQSQKLFDAKKPSTSGGEIEPSWGGKWLKELTAELGSKPK